MNQTQKSPAVLEHHIQMVPISNLTPNPRNARTHSKKQSGQIADSIRAFGFNNPILIDESNVIIAGHGRLQAAKMLKLETVPVICLAHLSDSEKRAYILADNKIALNAGWDTELLSLELAELTDLLPELDLSVDLTGFETAELDVLFVDHSKTEVAATDEVDLSDVPGTPVSHLGDIWELGPHRIMCEDARNQIASELLFCGEEAELVITDPPYNVRVQGHVGGRGKTKHAEFAFASGEMSDQEFRGFLKSSVSTISAHLKPGGLSYVFMDWRHIEDLLAAGRQADFELKNICVWHKTTPGQGSFYRSSHEMVAVHAKPGGTATNNIQLGKFGRNRSNVWSYPGVNTFQTRPGDPLSMHPTVKPIAMIAEAIKDASHHREIVFDLFLGSGTTLLAAEKVGRRCYGIEYEPKYIDLAIQRWQSQTGKDAVLVRRAGGVDAGAIGHTFTELKDMQSQSSEAM